MWTKQQIWRFALLAAGFLLVIWTIILSFKIGISVFLAAAPLAAFGYFVNRMFVKSLQISREQSAQAGRHVEELSHYISQQEKFALILQKSEERFRNAFDYAAVGMALVYPNGKFLKINRALCEILGYSEQELVEINFLNLVKKTDIDAFIIGLSKMLDGYELSSQMELRVYNKKKETCWLMSSSSLISDELNKSSHFIFQFQDITDKKRAEEQLIHDALHDVLTDLPNRALFLDRLDTAFRRAKRHFDSHFAVLYLDFDRFKLVNDSYGHLVGDQLLIEISERLKKILRASDTVARIGGDEFAMLVEDIANTDEAFEVAERIRREIAKVFKLNGSDFFTSISVGIAGWSRKYERPEFLLRDADTALYQAKRLGRNRCEIFDDEMHENALRFLQVETDLRYALERNEFSVVYQPVVELKSKRLAGFEALIRWRHPTRGMISPMEFIPIAEETGLINEIGGWVLETACGQTRQWQETSQELADVWVSVNVSTKQFAEPNLIAAVAEILRKTNFAPHCLKLEVTETAMVEDIEFAVEVIQKLKDLGVKIAIDDFGTGYSSLNYLHRLPLDSLKIDRSFVMQMGSGKESREIIKTIISLAKSLKLETIAEGVETISQISQLENLTCQFGQGYYFAKPLEAANVEKYIAEIRRQNLELESAA